MVPCDPPWFRILGLDLGGLPKGSRNDAKHHKQKTKATNICHRGRYFWGFFEDPIGKYVEDVAG